MIRPRRFQGGFCMDSSIYQNYILILKEELIPALGCTEPIAIAYAAAEAAALLPEAPVRMEVWCSGNIIKNVKSVTVPNSGGMKGIEAAAVLGMTGGDPRRKLEVLSAVTEEHICRTRELLRAGFCSCHLAENVSNLYILVKLSGGEHCAQVEIADRHTHITKKILDETVLFSAGREEPCPETVKGDRSLLNVRDILEFADTVRLEDVKDLLDRQIQMNSAISDEGLRGHYGADVGKTLLSVYGDDVKTRAKARAAAGSDARMSGCSLPVVINSGSGNQGMAVSLPVIEFAKELGAGQERLYRALVLSNLLSLHQKKYIGSLSAYCGAVSAACGSGAAITYLCGGGYEEISRTITATIANVGGIVCDGAKPSCAAKIASAVDAAIMAHYLSAHDHTFSPGDGLVKDNVEETIASLGRVGREGMRSTDVEILRIMTEPSS